MTKEQLTQWAADVSKAYDILAFGHTERAAEILAKTRNSMRKVLAQPEQEPDVVMHCESHTWTINKPPAKGSGDVNLYYSPAQPKQEPYSVQQAYAMAQVCLDLHEALSCKWGDNVYLTISQLKAAHGIKENT
jgi:hypothetical protein